MHLDTLLNKEPRYYSTILNFYTYSSFQRLVTNKNVLRSVTMIYGTEETRPLEPWFYPIGQFPNDKAHVGANRSLTHGEVVTKLSMLLLTRGLLVKTESMKRNRRTTVTSLI